MIVLLSCFGLKRGGVRRFLKAAKHDRLEVLYVLAVTGGCRQAELLGLRWEDVDLGAGRLTVRRRCRGRGTARA